MTQDHNVFISWAKPRSLWVAQAFRGWLPMVIQSAKPWMSDSDIDPGSRGLNEIAETLAGVKIGISCLTPENLDSPWILFEAGALSKTIDDKTRLYTYLLGGLEPGDVKPPLGMFQATRPEKEPTRKLVHSINRALNALPIEEATLNQLFDLTWPKLDEKLAGIPEPQATVSAKRSPEDMIAEILEIVRADANRRRNTDFLDEHIPMIRELLPFLNEVLRAANRGSLRNGGTPASLTAEKPVAAGELIGLDSMAATDTKTPPGV